MRKERVQEAGKALRVPEGVGGVGEPECPLVVGVSQGVEVFAAEDLRERLDGKEKVAALGGNPPVLLGGQGTASDHTVDMDVMLKDLIPGVQHHSDAQFAPEPPGIPSKDLQGLRGTVE